MDDDTLLRHSRHILLDQFGVEGQERIARSAVAVVGVGGLGNPAATYLVTSGIGSLTIIDDDEVDLTNLQRQTLFATGDIGQPKVEAAARRLAALNPETDVVAIRARLGEENARTLLSDADVILDCSDNFATRHLVNRACARSRKALVSGAAVRQEAQFCVFDLRDSRSPCYSCLFPEGTEHDDVPCSRLGVLAPLTGMVGSMQAAAALRLVVGHPGDISGKLILVDAPTMEFRRVRVPKDPGCPVCSRP